MTFLSNRIIYIEMLTMTELIDSAIGGIEMSDEYTTKELRQVLSAHLSIQEYKRLYKIAYNKLK